jgi:Family of unknown function (DUF5675)
MELELIRQYSPNGTNGEVRCGGNLICFSIELPWLLNQHNVSCIPEGRYELTRQFHPKYGDHLRVMSVPGRDGILIHPASDAKRDLRGCIAPVSGLIGPGKGTQSRLANEKLKALVFEALARQEKVFITIKSK